MKEPHPTILTINAEKRASSSKKLEKINQSLSLGELELEKKALLMPLMGVKITASPVKIKRP